jgi:hypothetical protein
MSTWSYTMDERGWNVEHVHDWILVSLNVSFEVACINVQEVGRMLGERRGTSLIFEKRDTTLPIVGEG